MINHTAFDKSRHFLLFYLLSCFQISCYFCFIASMEIENPEADNVATVKLFDKWSLQEESVRCQDLSIHDYVGIRNKCLRYLPHTAGRYQVKRFRKATCPIVERLVNSMMMHGRNNGKKLMAMRIVQHALEVRTLQNNFF